MGVMVCYIIDLNFSGALKNRKKIILLLENYFILKNRNELRDIFQSYFIFSLYEKIIQFSCKV